MKDFLTRLPKLWNYLKGDRKDHSVEQMVFHVFCLISLICLIIAIPVKLYIETPLSAILSICVFVIQCYAYYLSRFKDKLNVAVAISAIQIHLLFSTNYFINGGISGPSFLLFAVILFLLTGVSKRNHSYIWLVLNLLSIFILTTIEYFNGTYITKYASREDLFIDNIIIYMICISLIFYGTSYLRNSYLSQEAVTKEKAKALKLLNDEKDKIFSIISHDLRTPLANVQQYLEVLSTIDLDLEERQTMEKELLKTTQNAQELLTNLLYWSKHQMVGTNINLQDLNLKNELYQTFDLIQILSIKKKIEVKVNIADNLNIIADSEMLKLILRNVLHNAIKFTEPNGLIIVTASKDGNRCLISVKDNGKGIKKSLQKEIFTLKANTTYGTQQEKGTGIGLMLCKDYTEMQNGNIWFESTENEGTTFFVSLPLCIEELSTEVPLELFG